MDISAPDGNLHLDAGGNLALAAGGEAIRQSILHHMRLWRGEWFLAPAAGVPYYERVLLRPLPVASATISSAVRRIPGVRDVRDIAIDESTTDRAVEIRMMVDTTDGPMAIAVGL